MSKFAAFCFLLAVSACSKSTATEWIELGKSSDSTFFIHGRIDIPKNGRRYALIKTLENYQHLQTSNEKTAFMSATTEMLIDCATRSFGPVAVGYFSQPMGQGSAVESHSRPLAEAYADLHPVVGDSIAQAKVDFACSRLHQ